MTSLLQTLLKPDREDSEHGDQADVARAANILMVGEFQLLQLAYFDWHGEDLPPALTDRLFAAYMLRAQVPHWARHYARHIIDQDALGLIDPNDPGYHRYDADYVTHVPEGLIKFCKVAAVLVICIGGAVWIAQYASAKRLPFQFPPYVESPQDNRTNP
jgi:hypothetical protein